jgi:hypothetical protein
MSELMNQPSQSAGIDPRIYRPAGSRLDNHVPNHGCTYDECLGHLLAIL